MNQGKPEHALVRFFQFNQLGDPELAAVSRKFQTLARELDIMLPDGAEKTVVLRKLLESLDASHRTFLDRDEDQEAHERKVWALASERWAEEIRNRRNAGAFQTRNQTGDTWNQTLGGNQ